MPARRKTALKLLLVQTRLAATNWEPGAPLLCFCCPGECTCSCKQRVDKQQGDKDPLHPDLTLNFGGARRGPLFGHLLSKNTTTPKPQDREPTVPVPLPHACKWSNLFDIVCSLPATLIFLSSDARHRICWRPSHFKQHSCSSSQPTHLHTHPSRLPLSVLPPHIKQDGCQWFIRLVRPRHDSGGHDDHAWWGAG